MLSLSLGLPFGCGDDDGPVGPGDPAKIVAVNGLYYKGVMGDTIPDTILQFAVADKHDNYLPNQQIQLFPVEGDGHLNPKSITTDSSGIAGFPYVFNGDSGYAVIRLVAEGIDSLDIFLRANTLIPGPHGQGQYVLFDDTYANVKNFNGLPASVDIYQDHPIIYVDYEKPLGVVVMVYDLDTNGVIYDTSSVYGVIVNSVYEAKTADSIGIGSPIDLLRSAYGTPNSIEYSADDTAIVVEYESLGLTFYCDSVDTNVEEIHLIDWVPPPETDADSKAVLNLSDWNLRPSSDSWRVRKGACSLSPEDII
ncbi:MAG: hypothetical protein KAT58_10060 [candidate division Zixibacteria bacterium]|nr:hypothetical protein [candidate division Zixibacteria bacterium]